MEEPAAGACGGNPRLSPGRSEGVEGLLSNVQAFVWRGAAYHPPTSGFNLQTDLDGASQPNGISV